MTKVITREQIKEKLDNKTEIIIVESLPQKYFDAEHLPCAINIPHDKVNQLASSLLPKKSALIVVYCANTECQNSNIAAKALEKIGYTNVFEYAEGKQHWLEASYPVESSE